jgi:hypothetical protein
MGTDPFFNARSRWLAEQALPLGAPAVYQVREFVNAGGLMSYGGSLPPMLLARANEVIELGSPERIV